MGAFEPIAWAMKSAPVVDTEEWAVLVVMSEAANEDGCNAFQSTATIAERARLATRTVQRRIDSLVERALLAPGDQEYDRFLQIPAYRRPVNYDLMIPYSWWGAVRWVEMNRWRAQHGRRHLRESERPDIPEAPVATKRTLRSAPSTGVSPSQGVTAGQGVSGSHGVTPSPERGDSQSREGCPPVTQTTPVTTPKTNPKAPAAVAPARSRSRKPKGQGYDPAAVDLVNRYIQWRRKGTGKDKLFRESALYNALIKNYVQPALESGTTERDISTALAACAQAGHEWPTESVWRRAMNGELPSANGRPSQAPAVGHGTWDRVVTPDLLEGGAA